MEVVRLRKILSDLGFLEVPLIKTREQLLDVYNKLVGVQTDRQKREDLIIEINRLRQPGLTRLMAQWGLIYDRDVTLTGNRNQFQIKIGNLARQQIPPLPGITPQVEIAQGDDRQVEIAQGDDRQGDARQVDNLTGETARRSPVRSPVRAAKKVANPSEARFVPTYTPTTPLGRTWREKYLSVLNGAPMTDVLFRELSEPLTNYRTEAEILDLLNMFNLPRYSKTQPLTFWRDLVIKNIKITDTRIRDQYVKQLTKSAGGKTGPTIQFEYVPIQENPAALSSDVLAAAIQNHVIYQWNGINYDSSILPILADNIDEVFAILFPWVTVPMSQSDKAQVLSLVFTSITELPEIPNYEKNFFNQVTDRPWLNRRTSFNAPAYGLFNAVKDIATYTPYPFAEFSEQEKIMYNAERDRYNKFMIWLIEQTVMSRYPYYYYFMVKKNFPGLMAALEGVNSLDDFIHTLGLVLPRRVNPLKYIGTLFTGVNNGEIRRQLEKYLRARGGPRPPLPDGPRMTFPELMSIWDLYSDQELYDKYQPDFETWENSYAFRVKLQQWYNDMTHNHWYLGRNTNCSNDDRLTIYFEERAKTDPEDPILSYGTFREYRCYQVSELLASFRQSDTGFVFQRPDWRSAADLRREGVPNPQDEPDKYFSLESVYELYKKLIQSKNTVYSDLIRKIREGLEEYNRMNNLLEIQRNQFERFTSEERELIIDYLLLLFSAGLYARFWKGPNAPYPYKWIEGRLTPAEHAQLCTRQQGETNLNTKFIEMQELMDKAPANVRNFLMDLRRLEWSVADQELYVGAEKIDDLLTLAKDGKFCTADLNVKLLVTGYYMILTLLKIDEKQFDRLFRMKYQITNPQIAEFDIRRVGATGHIDPGLGIRLRREERRGYPLDI